MIAGDEVYGDDVTSGMFPDLLADPDFVRDELEVDHPPEATFANTVERPDLSKRTALSKSLLGSFEMCQTKTWYGIHDPRPFVTNEKVVFGSAVDAGVEVIVKALSSGQKPDLPRAFSAAAFIVEREDVEIVFSQVEDAIESFLYDVVPQVDFTHAVTQANVTATIPGLGVCNGHPDIIMDDGSVLDVKTSSRAKTVPSLELGFYALLLEATGVAVPSVGYLNYVRLKKPYWHGYTKRVGETMGQPLIVDVTDDLRSFAYEKAHAYVRAKHADDYLGLGEAVQNWSMTGGPRFDSMCLDCPYNPALGGPCVIAVKSDE
jgi:hypothetical protein